MVKESFAKNIYRLRKAKKWSQQKLADMAEVSYQTVFRAEAGTMPRIENIQKLARALEVSEGELLGPPGPHAGRSDLIASIVSGLTALNESELGFIDGFIRKALAERSSGRNSGS